VRLQNKTKDLQFIAQDLFNPVRWALTCTFT